MNRINLIAILAIAIIVSIPIAYSAVEPSIIINMLTGQTEKPIQIKNSTGTEIISIDTEGVILSKHFAKIIFEQDPELDFTLNCITCSPEEDDFIILAEWRVDFVTEDFGQTSHERIIAVGRGQAYIKTSLGTDFAEFGMFHKPTSATNWLDTPLFRVGTFDTAYQRLADINSYSEMCNNRNSVSDPCQIRVMLGGSGSNNATVSIRESFMSADLQLPSGATLTRIS